MAKKYPALKVHILENHWDAACKKFLEAGFTYATICQLTGIPTKNRVGYRAKQFGVKSTDYRRGVGPAARAAVEEAKASLAKATFKRRNILKELEPH